MRLNLTLFAFILSVILGTVSLSIGYYQAGLFDPARWFIWFGILWILAHWRKVHWISSLVFLLTLLGAAYGVWHELKTMWMLLGALAACWAGTSRILRGASVMPHPGMTYAAWSAVTWSERVSSRS